MVLLTKDQIGHFLKPLNVLGNSPNLRGVVSEIYLKFNYIHYFFYIENFFLRLWGSKIQISKNMACFLDVHN